MTVDPGRTAAPNVRNDCRSYEDALAGYSVLEGLAPFDPRIAGTPPLGLDLPSSDIDVLCFAPDVRTFTDTMWRACSDAPAFIAKLWVDPPRPWLPRLRRVAGGSNFTAKRPSRAATRLAPLHR
jgi:hypothetical protein